MLDKKTKAWKLWSTMDKGRIPKSVPTTDRFGTSYTGHKSAVEVLKLRNRELHIVNEVLY